MEYVDYRTNDILKTALIKLSVAMMSVLVTVSVVFKPDDNSLYITLFVFSLGKLIDNIESFVSTDNSKMHILFSLGIFDNAILSSLCIMSIAIHNPSTNSTISLSSNTIGTVNNGTSLIFPVVLFFLAVFLVIIDMANVIWLIEKIKRSKQLLGLFNSDKTKKKTNK